MDTQITYDRVKPVSPKNCNQKIPDHVFEVFNSMLEEKIDMNGRAVIALADVKARINNNNKPLRIEWLDIEPFYRKAGWKVTFEKPSYGDSAFEPHYVFSKK